MKSEFQEINEINKKILKLKKERVHMPFFVELINIRQLDFFIISNIILFLIGIFVFLIPVLSFYNFFIESIDNIDNFIIDFLWCSLSFPVIIWLINYYKYKTTTTKKELLKEIKKDKEIEKLNNELIKCFQRIKLNALDYNNYSTDEVNILLQLANHKHKCNNNIPILKIKTNKTKNKNKNKNNIINY